MGNCKTWVGEKLSTKSTPFSISKSLTIMRALNLYASTVAADRLILYTRNSLVQDKEQKAAGQYFVFDVNEDPEEVMRLL